MGIREDYLRAKGHDPGQFHRVVVENPLSRIRSRNKKEEVAVEDVDDVISKVADMIEEGEL